MKSRVSLVKCPDYQPQNVRDALSRSLQLLGGLSAFIKPGSRVLVKPNLLIATTPDTAIDTHPELIRQIVRLLKELGCRVSIGDGPSVWGNQDIEDVFVKSGMREVAESEGVRLTGFDRRRWRRKFPLAAELDDCDHLVSVPKFKTHGLTTITAAVKNLYGLVSGNFKTELHKNYYKAEDFCSILLDIYQEVKPSLTIVDGILALEGDGPSTSGKPRNLGILAAGADCVAIDSVLSAIIGLRPEAVPTTREAMRRNMGAADLGEIEIAGGDLSLFQVRNFRLPRSSFTHNLPQVVVEIAKKLLRVHPRIDQRVCRRCGACVKVCPAKAVTIRDRRTVIDYHKCISCFCCQESCPYAAIRMHKSLLTKLARL